MADTPGSINVEKTVSNMGTWGHISDKKEVCCELPCYLIDHFVWEVLSRVYSQGVAGAVFWFDMTIDDWVVKNVPIGRSGLCWIYQQLLHHPIHLKAGNIQLSENSFFSALSICPSVGISQSVNNVLESESIVVPVNTMWSLSYFFYSKCKVAFILRALEGIISHFTGEIVSALLPITDANKTQQPICQNICIALKWWKLERLSDTGPGVIRSRAVMTDSHQAKNQERWRKRDWDN